MRLANHPILRRQTDAAQDPNSIAQMPPKAKNFPDFTADLAEVLENDDIKAPWMPTSGGLECQAPLFKDSRR
jgi:hypothetical protein